MITAWEVFWIGFFVAICTKHISQIAIAYIKRAVKPSIDLSNDADEDKEKKKIKNHRKAFICSPYRAENEWKLNYNKQIAMRMSKEASLRGFAVFCPHLLYPLFLNDNIKDERDLAIGMGLVWLSHCDIMFIAECEPTEGMRQEIAAAEKLGIKIEVMRISL